MTTNCGYSLRQWCHVDWLTDPTTSKQWPTAVAYNGCPASKWIWATPVRASQGHTNISHGPHTAWPPTPRAPHAQALPLPPCCTADVSIPASPSALCHHKLYSTMLHPEGSRKRKLEEGGGAWGPHLLLQQEQWGSSSWVEAHELHAAHGPSVAQPCPTGYQIMPIWMIWHGVSNNSFLAQSIHQYQGLLLGNIFASPQIITNNSYP